MLNASSSSSGFEEGPLNPFFLSFSHFFAFNFLTLDDALEFEREENGKMKVGHLKNKKNLRREIALLYFLYFAPFGPPGGKKKVSK